MRKCRETHTINTLYIILLSIHLQLMNCNSFVLFISASSKMKAQQEIVAGLTWTWWHTERSETEFQSISSFIALASVFCPAIDWARICRSVARVAGSDSLMPTKACPGQHITLCDHFFNSLCFFMKRSWLTEFQHIAQNIKENVMKSGSKTSFLFWHPIFLFFTLFLFYKTLPITFALSHHSYLLFWATVYVCAYIHLLYLPL